jgi:hypothetical protein
MRFVFVVMAIAACSPSPDDVVSEVEAATRTFEAVQVALDVEGAVAMLSPDFAMYADGQYLPYDAVVGGIRDGFARARSVSTLFNDLRVVAIGPDAAVASFTFQDSIVMTDGTFTRSRGATTLVWERRAGRWVMVAGHAEHEAEPSS